MRHSSATTTGGEVLSSIDLSTAHELTESDMQPSQMQELLVNTLFYSEDGDMKARFCIPDTLKDKLIFGNMPTSHSMGIRGIAKFLRHQMNTALGKLFNETFISSGQAEFDFNMFDHHRSVHVLTFPDPVNFVEVRVNVCHIAQFINALSPALLAHSIFVEGFFTKVSDSNYRLNRPLRRVLRVKLNTPIAGNPIDDVGEATGKAVAGRPGVVAGSAPILVIDSNGRSDGKMKKAIVNHASFMPDERGVMKARFCLSNSAKVSFQIGFKESYDSKGVRGFAKALRSKLRSILLPLFKYSVIYLGEFEFDCSRLEVKRFLSISHDTATSVVEVAVNFEKIVNFINFLHPGYITVSQFNEAFFERNSVGSYCIMKCTNARSIYRIVGNQTDDLVQESKRRRIQEQPQSSNIQSRSEIVTPAFFQGHVPSSLVQDGLTMPVNQEQGAGADYSDFYRVFSNVPGLEHDISATFEYAQGAQDDEITQDNSMATFFATFGGG
jgi:hypothetical protein